MKKFIGFASKSGVLTSDKGELIPWSNRYIRFMTDDDLTSGDFGYCFGEVKLSKKQVCYSLCISEDSNDDVVNNALVKIFDSTIELTFGRVGNDYKPVGFKVINSFPKK